MANDYFFTSESVSEGHPDKVADQISDAILDAILAQDPKARVAAETLCNTGLVVLAGEITTHANVDYIQVARNTLREIGYDNTAYGIDYKGCAVLVAYDKQSPDIAQGVDKAHDDGLDQGAGDQGLMFGYACDETAELMPLPIHLSHRLVERQSQLRRDGRLTWLRPDAKSQVTLRYVNGKPDSIDTVVLSTQHDEDISLEKLREAVIEEIIKPVLPAHLIKGDIKYLVNPTGRFVIGGPQGDCGLTGRKIIVDTYGGAAPPGGGAFSGKHPRRVLKISRQPISLDRPVGESEDSYFGDFIEDNSVDSPVQSASTEMLKDKIDLVLKTLTYREREIIKLRYGLGDGYSYTLEEVGRIFKVTRERVRQIEAKAVRKLQHPVRSRQLEGFVETLLKR